MYKLREINRDDLSVINQWRNDPELMSNLGSPFAYTNLERDNNWYDNYLKNRSTNVRCAIINKEDDRIIGVIYLLDISAVNRSAELALMIGDKADRGHGAGRFAVESMLRHAFMDLNLNRVSLGVLSTNSRALRLYEKTGFKTEGICRQARYKNGTYCDLVMMAVLHNEWGEAHE